ncbi:alpha-galactosidase [Diaminobutyricibacter tongyongensis]|uniref:Alpha-galactosidase n=1 Tax=Leifsonia tongyongensis TaxID=1268043 RepID=A0A6L9XVI1_9MICO|nr:alpha-galactosidase [Diaminobutyricibacter tongyongensis]NEN05306.1 alpha-galactosidase [Diaminobutyricibacter tongyongensis]
MNTQTLTSEIVALRGGAVSLLVELCRPVPHVLHWGADLGVLTARDIEALRASSTASSTHNSTEDPRTLTVLPTEADAWSGTPGIEGAVRDGSPYARFALTGHHMDVETNTLAIELADERTGLAATVAYKLDAYGILAVDIALGLEDGVDRPIVYDLAAVTALMPLPERATEYLDFTGKWSRERSPQRGPITAGTHLRESRRGRPSLDSPYILMAGSAGFTFRTGEVWAVHAGWSGNQRYLVEQLPEGAGANRSVLGAGELLLPGEISLRPGGTYQAPTVYFTWSGTGMDGVSDAFHGHLRSRPSHPRSPRPLTLNTWEAVYFDHDIDALKRLVASAARVGVERLVLDDGWFTGRRDATNGLGDWSVDDKVWPAGLWPLVNTVREAGMQFGLWFEPEMVNLGSQLAEQHPDWILAPSEGTGPSIRHQFVLNLANEEAWLHVLDRIDAIVTEYRIDYIKWDHNRELHEAALRGLNDRAGVHAQTEALYRMIDELKLRHPGLEIESCASGGGRIDLGILQRTDRVWVSDCNDPVERQNIQRWTSQLIPPELMGNHVGAGEAHTTHRVTSLSFRLATALFGHAGIELDMTRIPDSEVQTIARWADLYKELRGLLHNGRTVRADVADEAVIFNGVVAHDQSEALYAWTRLATSAPIQSGRVRFPGLSTDRHYRIQVRTEIGATSIHETPPAWLETAKTEGFCVSGAILAGAGLPMPTLDPQQSLLFHLTSTSE